jgi:hypothetical protein
MKKGSKIAMLYAFFPSPPCSLFPHVLEENNTKGGGDGSNIFQ